ncbi:surface-adhesin protein E [Cricetibacter osteomyelitidis]|uniref:Surface-adhesin protein n=1 Tax=Cricetibacter osteomyelitidis TaxID=1521931 RepID=A0A4R2TI35_9PAST|nr:surface-adhesin E family protein [Cricetibacter osteomyelitidis]TCP96888.1 surface-adhesin protein E [Cricetibacter osteomyelitidis]
MKKLRLPIAVLVLAGCSVSPPTTDVTKPIILTPPTEVQAGYIQVMPKAQYFIDAGSIWQDNKEPELVHFEAVVNLTRGYHIYPKYPKEYSKSARQAKTINCKNHRLTRLDIDYYSEFWGEGLRETVRQKGRQTIDLKKGSTLDTVASVICANYYHH